MAAFEYQAVDGDGKTQKGLIEADTAKQAHRGGYCETGATAVAWHEFDAARNW
jgi:hypothetical protein